MKWLFLLITSFLLIIPQPVNAHVLKSSGSVGAVMHVTPDDDPIAGQESSFFFEFKDRENKFKPENCDCNIFILQSGKEIFNYPLFANNPSPSLDNASFSFTFPQRDIYKVKITGKPLTEGAFNDFTLEYDLRVERVSEDTQTGQVSEQSDNSNWLLNYFPFLAAGFLVLSLLFWFIKKRK